MSTAVLPTVLGPLEKRADGDDALLWLARLRLEQAGLGAEVYASSPQQLDALSPFRPRCAARMVVHLPRDLDLLTPEGQGLVGSMASAGEGRVGALVVHDQPQAVSEPDAYLEALRALDKQLSRMADPPPLCIEYAIGLEAPQFARLVERFTPLQHVGACVDIGHVGIAEARRVFASVHPGQDVCSWCPTDPRLPQAVGDVQRAVRAGRNAACRLTEEVAALGKLMHMHLHDAHPLSTVSPWGVSDHLSFLDPIAVPFQHHGRWSLDTMFGPTGLVQVLEAALCERETMPSFTLEIHPAQGHRPLADAEALFEHWRDRTNAEWMNQWLFVLHNNHVLFRAAYECVRSRA